MLFIGGFSDHSVDGHEMPSFTVTRLYMNAKQPQEAAKILAIFNYFARVLEGSRLLRNLVIF